ncbi:MAG: type II 3-dehydroquinate dehydratase [Phenylobacterium sp.]
MPPVGRQGPAWFTTGAQADKAGRPLLSGRCPPQESAISRRVHALNGPNLNLLGQREPHLYGSRTLADVEALCASAAARHGFDLDFRQTNREYEMIDWIQAARKDAGLVINPAGVARLSIHYWNR